MITLTSALSMVAVEYAEHRLQESTENPPIGIIVGLENSKIVGEVLEGANLQGLRLTVLRDAPWGFWMLYNTQDFVVSELD